MLNLVVLITIAGLFVSLGYMEDTPKPDEPGPNYTTLGEELKRRGWLQ